MTSTLPAQKEQTLRGSKYLGLLGLFNFVALALLDLALAILYPLLAPAYQAPTFT